MLCMAATVVVAALYYGRDLLIPLALATLLAFVLAQGFYLSRHMEEETN